MSTNDFAFDTAQTYQTAANTPREEIKAAMEAILGKKAVHYCVWLYMTPTRELARLSVEEMVARGLTFKQARKLKAAIFLGREAISAPLRRGEAFDRSERIASAMRAKLGHLEQETFWAVLFDVKMRVIREVHISAGDIGSSTATPRMVFSAALREKASRIILIHNHPSGDPEPSPEDFRLTERLKQAGALVGVEVVDHVIITSNKHYSFADHGKM